MPVFVLCSGGCGSTIQRTRTSAAEPCCRACRHSYSRGCRCDECRESKRLEMQRYFQSRRTEGRPCDYRRRETRDCERCGASFHARLDIPGRFCSTACANEFQGGSGRAPRIDRFRVSDAFRSTIYERDSWVCQICNEPVDRIAPAASDWFPSLDHIVPRSLGGVDDAANLRLAHRWCNSVRGNLSHYTDADLQRV